MPRPPNTEERRAQITAGLIEVMARQGYDGASVNQIAKAAGLTPGLVHYHFKTKLEILLAALEHLVEEHRARLEAYLAGIGTDPPTQVSGFIEFHLGMGRTADSDALRCWILLSGEALRRTEVQQPYARAIENLVERLRNIVEKGIREHTFRCKSSTVAASAIVTTIQGYFVLGATAQGSIPTGSAASATLEMAEGVLHPKLPLPLSEVPR